MTKIKFLLPLTAALILGACGVYSEKNYKKYSGISYEEYDRQTAKDQAAQRVEPLEENVNQNDIDAPEPSGENLNIEEEIIESSNSSYGEAAVVMASKKISLGKDASYQDMQTFQTALDEAYKAALQKYRAAGFTYAMSPVGTVNPLSLLDVQCLLSESYATAKGKEVCDFFFSEIPLRLEELKLKNAAAQ